MYAVCVCVINDQPSVEKYGTGTYYSSTRFLLSRRGVYDWHATLCPFYKTPSRISSQQIFVHIYDTMTNHVMNKEHKWTLPDQLYLVL